MPKYDLVSKYSVKWKTNHLYNYVARYFLNERDCLKDTEDTSHHFDKL